jgi:hypothetical protein
MLLQMVVKGRTGESVRNYHSRLCRRDSSVRRGDKQRVSSGEQSDAKNESVT